MQIYQWHIEEYQTCSQPYAFFPYINYYGLEKGSEKYEAVVNSNIVKTLATAFDVADIDEADLAAEAEAFLMEEMGLSQEEVDVLKAKLEK